MLGGSTVLTANEIDVLYEAVNTDKELLPPDLFAQMIDDETDEQTVLSWFKVSAVQH